MNAALAWLMASRWRAAMIVLVLAALGVPLTHLIAASVIALVVLRRGPLEGLLVAGIAASALAAFSAVTGTGIGYVGGVAIVLWLPVLVLASVLRRTSSQASVLALAGVLGCSIVVGMFAAFGGDPAAMWEDLMRDVLIPSFEEAGFRISHEQVLARAATMTGWIGALWALVYYASVVLARWAQAKLYNPGGFAREFHSMRLGVVAAVVAGAVVFAAMVSGLPLMMNLAVVMVAVYAAQGFAVAHGLIAGTGAHWVWLVPAYLLGLVMPVIPAVMGFVDYWVDFRRRFGAPT